MIRTLTVPEGRSGFPGIAHGGYLCGVLAQELGSDCVVTTFRKPVPTGEALSLDVGEVVRVMRGEELLASCERAGAVEALVQAPVSPDEAVRASASYPGHKVHPFAGCYCCGTANESGLHVFAGQVPGRPPGFVAAPWTPPGVPGAPVLPSDLWAALDCPAIWALMVAAPAHSAIRVVTGRLQAQRLGEVRAGELHTICAWPAGRTPGKHLALAALHDAAGTPVALMLQTCIEVTGWGVPLSLG